MSQEVILWQARSVRQRWLRPGLRRLPATENIRTSRDGGSPHGLYKPWAQLAHFDVDWGYLDGLSNVEAVTSRIDPAFLSTTDASLSKRSYQPLPPFSSPAVPSAQPPLKNTNPTSSGTNSHSRRNLAQSRSSCCRYSRVRSHISCSQ